MIDIYLSAKIITIITNLRSILRCNAQQVKNKTIAMKKKSRFRWLRILLRVIIVLFGSFIILCLVFDHYIELRTGDARFEQFFRENHVPGEIKYYTAGGRRIRYLSIGND